MIANLHNHTIYSDGDFTPEQVAQMGANEGLELIAITDHNTFDSYLRFKNECDRLEMACVKGIEIDVVQPEINYYSELLAYFPNGGEHVLDAVLEQKRSDRSKRVLRAVVRLNDYFGSEVLSYESLAEQATSEKGFVGMISNKFVYRYLCEHGVVLPQYRAVQNSPWWKDAWSMEGIVTQHQLYETIELVNEAGGYAVLPHWGIYCRFDVEDMRTRNDWFVSELRNMKSHGLWGIEIHPYRYLPQASQINEIVTRWADKAELTLTYGSDFHGGISTHNRFNAVSGDFNGFHR